MGAAARALLSAPPAPLCLSTQRAYAPMLAHDSRFPPPTCILFLPFLSWLLPQGVEGSGGVRRAATEACRTCKTATHVRPLYLPYVFRYLTNELAAMGIKLTLSLTD